MAVEVTSEDVMSALRSMFGSEDVAVDSWAQISLMEDGRLGYLGDHFKVEATARCPASAPASKERRVSLFVKALPRNAEARATVQGVGAFKKEALFYKLLSKDMADALGGGFGADFQPFVFPRCHLIKDDCMLLDDLTVHGFTGIDGRQPMPIEHCRLVVEALGELHAGSLVLEERRGRSLLDQFPELGFETFFSPDPQHCNRTWHAASIKLAVAIVPHLDKYKADGATIAKVQAALPAVLDEFFHSLGAWPGVRNVMCHGDVWVNNFIFRHDKEGKPVEVSLVDFQLARYTPPAHDLVMFVTFCTDKAVWDKHMPELTRLHWDSIARALARAGLDADKVLPWSEHRDVAAKQWKYGLIQQTLEYPFALAPSEFMAPLLEDPAKFRHHCHVDRTEAIIGLYREDKLFHQRFNEVMESLIDGYILGKA